MRFNTILISTLLSLAAACVQAQQSPSLYGTLSDHGKPVSGALVILDRMKNAKCARIFTQKTSSISAGDPELESCEEELPRSLTDDRGNYSFPDLTPGWYNVRFLWPMSSPPSADNLILCSTEEWGVAYAPTKDATGKYDGIAQKMPFELKKHGSKQVDFDYRGQITGGAECTVEGGPGLSRSQPGKQIEARLSIPGIPGTLTLEPGPTLWEVQFMPDREQARLEAMHREDRLLVTAFLQKVSFEAGAEKCRDARWPGAQKRLLEKNAKLEDIRVSGKDGAAMVEFMLQEAQGKTLRMKDVHVYRGSGNLCAEVHLSKIEFQPGDQKLFDEVLATARFLP